MAMHREGKHIKGSAEKDLRTARERFDLILRVTNKPVWEWQADEDSVWFNQAFCNVFGYQPEETQPGLQFWTERIHPDDAEGILQRFSGLSRG
jgi:PAS domain-containing protein